MMDIETKKEKKRLANKKYREANPEKIRELMRNYYWKHIDEPEFKQKLQHNANKFKEKNKQPEFILMILET